MLRNVVSSFYNLLLDRCRKATYLISLSVLVLSLVVGASYRVVDIKENFEINNGFEFFVNMASQFWTAPGGYNFEESLRMKQKPDDYIFTHRPKEPATGSFENEKGWAFILSLIFAESTKDINNLAMIVVRYQLMLDLLVIVLLFFTGRAIAGSLGGSLSAILYALFKPSIRMVSWVSYYYWAIPFSAFSLFFWTVIYRPEKKKYSLKILSLLFLLYGMLIGFATSMRLGFLFLPLVLSPLVFLREHSFKKGLTLIVVMFIGQAILLLPQVLITHKWYGKWSLSVRGKWHSVISGLGAYPNPFAIKDTADLTAVQWAIDRGGPDLNKVGIQEYDKFMKKEAISLFKERPDIFLHNFKNNIYAGITLTPKDMVRYVGGPAFIGILDNDKKYFIFDPKIIKFTHLFPWLVLLNGIIFFLFGNKNFLSWLTVVFQGVYLLCVLCIYFTPADVHTTAYFPVFVLLLALALATMVKILIDIFKKILRCRSDIKKITQLPSVINECFRQRENRSVKYFFVFIIVFFICLSLFIIDATCLKDKMTVLVDNKIVGILNNALNTTMNGNFENWNGNESIPMGWSSPQIKNKEIEIRKTIEAKTVKSGISSVEIKANHMGDGYIAYSVPSDTLYYLLGNNVSVSGWIKSADKKEKSIYISIVCVNRSRYNNQKTAYYNNNGDWENLKIIYKIPINTQAMYILCGANAGVSAFFDEINMKCNGK